MTLAANLSASLVHAIRFAVALRRGHHLSACFGRIGGASRSTGLPRSCSGRLRSTCSFGDWTGCGFGWGTATGAERRRSAGTTAGGAGRDGAGCAEAGGVGRGGAACWAGGGTRAAGAAAGA